MQTVENMGDSIFDAHPVPPSLVDVLPILRAAKEVEPENLRVAYLCRFHTSGKAHRLDPTCSGRGVRQFMAALLQTLQRDNELTLIHGKENNDTLEMQQFYLNNYENFNETLENAVDKADRDLLTKSYQTEAVLFEVVKAVNMSQEIDQAVFETHCKIEEKRELYAPPPPPDLDTWDYFS